MSSKIPRLNSKTPIARSRPKEIYDDASDQSFDNHNVSDLESIKSQIKIKSKTLGELSNSVNTLAKKKGKLRSEIEHLIISKNSFYDNLTRIRKMILSQRLGSILQYFPENNTGLVLYD
jgi:hypothetical protein